MNNFRVVICFALIAITTAEPPVHHGGEGGYTYSLESSGSAHGIGTIGYSTIGSSGGGGDYAYSDEGHGGGYDISSVGHDGGHGGHGSALIGGGDYTAVSSGYQTYEGKHVDPILLHKVKEILLDHENLEESRRGSLHGGLHGGHGHGLHGHGLSSTYGVPSSHYGIPSYNTRVVGIELGHVTPGIQVAQYHQSQHLAIPSGSYGAPAIHLPAIPSGSYGVPSGSYGVPHHH